MNASITLRYPPPSPLPTTYSIHAAHPTSPNHSHNHTPTTPHPVIADYAILDIPHANPWLLTGTVPPAPRSPWSSLKILIQDASGCWESRSQSPQSDSDEESEVLLLDDDILERDLSTGCIGRCGERGCRSAEGCVQCVGQTGARKSSPRTQFRKNVVTVAAEKEQVVEEVYPTHLQRLETSTIMVAVTPPQPLGRTGPKIKYIRKRTTPMVQKVGVGNKRRKTAAGRFAKKGDGAK
ncbi:hypothetical protein Q9L58_006927 [Maublancomyces gigas]|uniref:Uncharacterized protein n=1 Tax=Discina gigas TaxID=1032678 RepID=A0ABR3GEA5_9PEZI